jgi:hydroxypyruvate reductase/glycerate 2-kinase
MDNHEIARHIFLAGIKGVLPGKLINDLIYLRGSVFKIGYMSYDLKVTEKIFVIGAGKASAAMAHYLESILGGRITKGFVVTKYGYSCKLKYITLSEAGHPVPDANSYKAAEEILNIASGAGENDLVICLWSGGGSSLLADHPEFSSFDDMALLNEKLVKCGADIGEMNAVRKHLSKVKGGQLAKHITPASYVSILLSDVIGDPADIIASGPTVPDNSTFSDALRVIEKYNLAEELPPVLLNYLRDGVQGLKPETPKPGDEVFRKSALFYAGNNKTALQCAKAESESLGFETFIVTDSLKGDTEDAAAFIINGIHNCRNDNSVKKPACLLYGGETTVRVTGIGKGGRNQHLALYMAFQIRDVPGITFLSGGTDGNDGDTDAAGAGVNSETIRKAHENNIDPEVYLKNFDSYNFFKLTGGLIITGPTLTNVMDLMVAIIE